MNRALAISMTCLAAACGGGGAATDDDPVVPVGDPIDGVTVDCRSPDTDEDRLPDCEEAVLGTSPRAVDTDGDGLSDFEEVVERNFDPTSNNFRFNPRIADLPRLSFSISSLPDVRINYTTTEGTTETIGVERTQESARTVSTSQTQERSHAIEETITTETTLSLDPSFSVSGSLSESWSESVSFTDTQTRENRNAFTRSQETSRQSGVTLIDGTLRVTLAVENRGYQSVRLERLVVAALEADPRRPGTFTPIANLDFESNDGFAPIEIPPNGSSSDQLIFSANLDLATALALLESSRNLVLEPAIWTAVDVDGRSFNAPLETIGTKCARVVIDYGPGRRAESHFVSAVTDFDQRRLAATAMLEDVLRVPFEMRGGMLTSVRDVSADAATDGRWVVAITTNDGVSIARTIHDPNENPIDFAALDVGPGSVLELVYVEDADGDGLLSRDEFLAGASDDDRDSDDDGLDDYTEAKIGWDVPLILDEVVRVYSSPATADIDVDGYDDRTERELGTNPNRDDTDRDGIRDDLDPEPANVSAVAYLPADGDGTAAIGNNWTNNGATPASDRHGRSGGALRFDGSSIVSVDTVYDRRITTGAAWSLWIRPEGLEPGVQLGVLNHDPNQETWNSLWVGPEGIGGSGSSFGRHFIGLVEETGNVTSGWHHVVGVLADRSDEIPGADTFQIYYDGVLRAEIYDPRGPHLAVDVGEWVLGGGSRAGFGGFVGLVDDLRFYERGLTAEEVTVLYEAR